MGSYRRVFICDNLKGSEMEKNEFVNYGRPYTASSNPDVNGIEN